MLNSRFSATDILSGARMVNYDLSVPELVEEAVKNGEGRLSDRGAVCIYTGKYTGRSPKDRFIVDTDLVHNSISWTNNKPCSEETFRRLYKKMRAYAKNHKLYVSDNYVGADSSYRMKVTCINEMAAQHLFLKNLFITSEEKLDAAEEFTLVCCPSVKANPVEDEVNSEAFVIINFDCRMVLIGGTGYCGEMKKSIFSVMNYLLPQKGILSMHCSANVGKDGKTAIFFGLSGTGKTTLSADPNRSLIGDDEHGWSEHGVFNIEGGCYAKCIHLSEETEPQIFNALKYGSILENVKIDSYTHIPDFDDARFTENTRGAYTIENIPNAIHPSMGGHPNAIIFLTADAFGVLPPISRLDAKQSMYHFLSGYTSKVAGTERGIVEPQATFSIGFGEPFLPLSPLIYARLLEKKIKEYGTRVYLVNTGWTGGPYGVGSRMKLRYTRAMVTAALDGKLDAVEWTKDPIFQVEVPASCPDVPTDVLTPINTWCDKNAYKKQAAKLVNLFQKNVKRFKGEIDDDILSVGPRLPEEE